MARNPRQSARASRSLPGFLNRTGKRSSKNESFHSGWTGRCACRLDARNSGVDVLDPLSGSWTKRNQSQEEARGVVKKRSREGIPGLRELEGPQLCKPDGAADHILCDCLFLIALGSRSELSGWLAWIYVASRMVHSLVHATVNIVTYRLAAFMAGSLCVALLAVQAAVQLVSP